MGPFGEDYCKGLDEIFKILSNILKKICKMKTHERKPKLNYISFHLHCEFTLPKALEGSLYAFEIYKTEDMHVLGPNIIIQIL